MVSQSLLNRPKPVRLAALNYPLHGGLEMTLLRIDVAAMADAKSDVSQSTPRMRFLIGFVRNSMISPAPPTVIAICRY